MNDRFRFRAFYHNPYEEDDCDNRKMFYDAENTYDYLNGVPASSFGGIIDSDFWTVEQCTGLKDKNGKLIFENDYIENDNTKDDVYLVVFDEKTARFMAKETNGNLRLINKNVRVVGNIHEKESK